MANDEHVRVLEALLREELSLCPEFATAFQVVEARSNCEALKTAIAAIRWSAECRRVLEDVATEMRATGRGDTRFVRLIESMPRTATLSAAPPAEPVGWMRPSDGAVCSARDKRMANVQDASAYKVPLTAPVQSAQPHGAEAGVWGDLILRAWSLLDIELPNHPLVDELQAALRNSALRPDAAQENSDG